MGSIQENLCFIQYVLLDILPYISCVSLRQQPAMSLFAHTHNRSLFPLLCTFSHSIMHLCLDHFKLLSDLCEKLMNFGFQSVEHPLCEDYPVFYHHLKDFFFVLLQHLLPLPGFLILYDNIYSHIISFAQSAPVTIPVIGVALPKLYLYLAGNVLTQYPFIMFHRHTL